MKLSSTLIMFWVTIISCGNSRTISDKKITAIACEGTKLSITCDRGKRISISSGVYGADDLIPQKCSSPRRAIDERDLNCTSTSALAKIKGSCHNKRTCQLMVNGQTFGELCPSLGKYLKITYMCVSKNIMRSDGHVSDLEPKTSPISSESLTTSDCNCTTSVVLRDHKHSPGDSSLTFGWIHSITYIKDNQEKLILYGILCGCIAFICALIAFIARIFYVKYTKTKRSRMHQKLNVTEPAIQDTSNEENTYIAAGDPSDMMQYNLGYRDEATNRLNSGPGSYRGSSSNRVYNTDTPRFNTNSLTVTNPLHGEHRRNLDRSPLTTPSTAMNNSPNTAVSGNRNTYYENSGDDECTIDDNNPIIPGRSHTMGYDRAGSGSDVRTRTNSLFDRHS